MLLFLGSFLVISFAALAMGLGVIMGRRPMVSGCQSLRLGAVSGCDVCRDRRVAQSSEAASALGRRDAGRS